MYLFHLTERESFSDLIVDADWDGLMCGAILLRASPGAGVHIATGDGLESVLSALEPTGGPIAIADLSVNENTWPGVRRELARLSSRPIVWFDSHEFHPDGGPDPRTEEPRVVFEPGVATARIVQRAVGEPATERLARAAEMSDQTRLPRTDRELWRQVYLARPAVSQQKQNTGWLADIVKRLAANPDLDFRALPALEDRGARAADEMWDAVAAIHARPSRTFEDGLVAIWMEPPLPASIRARPGPVAGGLARNRTAIVILPSSTDPGRLDIRARIPYFWKGVDLRVLDGAVAALGGFGSGHPGAVHWVIPREALAGFLKEVERLAPKLHGEPRGPVGGLPPRREA